MKNTSIEKLEPLTIPLQDINLIRSRLREALQAFQKVDTDDEVLAELIHKFSAYKDEASSR
jgi:hypothetical protein